MVIKPENKLSVGIVSPANLRAGVQRVVAMAASDLAGEGHSVSIFVPLLPWYYYFVTLNRRPLRWLRYVLPHLRDWARNRRFSFHDLLSGEETGGRISVKFVFRKASKSDLKGLDCLILHTIAQVAEYQGRFPQERQVYVLHHPEEHTHKHADIFKAYRRSFQGKILVISPFTAREVSDHVFAPPVVPDPISPLFWGRRRNVENRHIVQETRRDILFQWKDNEYGRLGMKVIKELTDMRPQTTITVWCSGLRTMAGAQRALPTAHFVENLADAKLVELYWKHSFLLFPSTYEGFGLPPIEGLACGCIPILYPGVGAADLYAKDGENSIFLSENPEVAARRAAALLDSPEALRAMRVTGVDSIALFSPYGYGSRILEAAGILDASKSASSRQLSSV